MSIIRISCTLRLSSLWRFDHDHFQFDSSTLYIVYPDSLDRLDRMPDDAVSTAAPAAEDETTPNTTMSVDESNSNNNSNSRNKVGERAHGRWKLLRRAIVRSAATATAAETEISS
jgi:hypothetical protein